MFRFLFDRLSNLPGERRWNRPGRHSRRVLSLLAVIGFIGVSLNGMTVNANTAASQSQPQNQPQPQIVLPKLSTEPPVYYPESGVRVDPLYEPASFTPAPASTEVAQTAQVAPDSSVPSDSSEPSNQSPAAEPSSQPRARATRRPTQPLSQYVMEFNRSPVVGNRLRLQGVYPETRIGFTRPRNWQIEDAQVILRYQHSPSLLPDKSKLLVRVNDTSIGSINLDRKNAQLAEATFTIPANLIQDYNEISMLAEQQTAETCSNPADPMLWTEILPDSKLVLDYRPQPVALNFSSYPFPFLDPLSLEPNHLTYLRPKTYSSDWLTATARFQTAAARQVDYRPLKTTLADDTAQLQRDDRLIVIGTPAEQPILSTLSLPFPVKNGQLLDGDQNPVPNEVGLLMLTTLKDKGTPVLIATGNGATGVRQAVQFLVQSRDQQIGTGQAVTVDQLSEVPTPEPRNWAGYLPTKNEFQLKDLSLYDRQPFQDVTVRGTNAPPINIPFRALPDDRFLRGSTMLLRYSYSPQVNSRTSAVEVKIDGVTIGSKRLDSTVGGPKTFRVNLPENLIQPDSTLSVNFVMNPRELGVCGLETDQQLWGTLHGDTGFKLVRDTVVNLPDLKLFKTGFPFTAPQDLSGMAVVLPANPNDAEVGTLLALSERLGRLSQADSVKYDVYTGELPPTVRDQQHIAGIGLGSRFPIAEALEDQGFNLAAAFSRFWGGSRVYALPDQEGVLKSNNSPWNRERVLLALTAQTEAGLQEVQALLRQDPLFSQIRGDTVLVSRNQPNPSPYDASGYNLKFLEEAPPQRIQQSNSFNQLILFLQDYWFLLLVGMLSLALLLYALSQLFLNRVANSGDV
ncbi:cellulose biosynthesis cyclic di-GMP-binding regulatory protein BcsB [Leptolyngbya sp. NK1-12]|uniref:Cellulose biosynthesis cyclic di-GMP-binding regulatory protein BcsB n=1 Tax=Leptolyngbya sp. NK1-12 TaxID=2547451 RepID=A0AA97AJL4_9CYAN|nr:cellulose biosynthesis cyclic di-GMP-binding regulatory protein BcsB [Leptolyngbya sp. NK1-12]WNZ22802.1 cellulose biosynthesis cyclic di-GMP-binding regulatory protein BcsB [Leptolyngbya sp. NK1-12]